MQVAIYWEEILITDSSVVLQIFLVYQQGIVL